MGVIWELWFEAVLPKAFLVSNIPSSVLVTAGQDTWHGSLACLPAVSWLAGSSICSHAPCQDKPWDKVWEVRAGCVLWDCSYCRKLCVCVCEQQTCSWLFSWIYRSEGGNQTIRGSHASIFPHWAGRNTLKKICLVKKRGFFLQILSFPLICKIELDSCAVVC